MNDDRCSLLGCRNPFHDHEEREALPPAADLIDTEDPAFPTVARILTDMRDAGADLTPDAVRAAIALGRHYHGRDTAELPMPTTRVSELGTAVVYYVRMGNLIKIGTTADFKGRMSHLQPDEILAIEPGSYHEERARHLQFSRYRARGEYFFPARALMAHIEAVARRHARAPKNAGDARRRRKPSRVVAERGLSLF